MYLVGLRIYYKMIHGPYDINLFHVVIHKHFIFVRNLLGRTKETYLTLKIVGEGGVLPTVSATYIWPFPFCDLHDLV